MAPIVDALIALRGIDKLSAMTPLAKLDDISRFQSPRQLMAYLGLVPSEYNSGGNGIGGIIPNGRSPSMIPAINPAS